MRHLKFALAFLFALATAAFAEQPVKSISSGNVANASAVATLAGGTQQFTYLTGFEATFSGATAAVCVNLTITGGLGGTLTYPVCAPAGATLAGYPVGFEFIPPLRSSAVNTSFVVTLPALGAGNTNAAVNAHGYVE
jgi:hypothetical protein